MNQTLPEDFDWISARADCSPTQAFMKLRVQIQDDLTKRVAGMSDQEKSKYSFKIVNQDWEFWVSVEGPYIEKGITFRRTSAGINVHDASSDKLLFQGILTLSNDGRCKFKVEDAEYDFWQFRKLALEDILFTSVAKWRP